MRRYLRRPIPAGPQRSRSGHAIAAEVQREPHLPLDAQVEGGLLTVSVNTVKTHVRGSSVYSPPHGATGQGPTPSGDAFHGALLGGLFIAAGLNELGLGSTVGGGWKVLHYIITVIFLLGGQWAFIRPINTFFALASVLGLVLVLQSAFEIVRAVSSRGESPYWWLGLVSGVLLVLLAFWVCPHRTGYSSSRRAPI